MVSAGIALAGEPKEPALTVSLAKTKVPRFAGRLPPGDNELILFALPAMLGGLGLRNTAESADNEFQSSMVTDPLKKLILTKKNNSKYSFGCFPAQLQAKQKTKEQCEQKVKHVAKERKTRLTRLPESSRKAMDFASEQCASTWLTSPPICQFGFCLHKSAFVDAISLQYGWHPPSTPTQCV